MRIRSPREIGFRLWQEASNLRLRLAPPRLGSQHAMLPIPALPDPGPVVDGLRDSAFAAEVIRYADGILRQEIPLLGDIVHFSQSIDWRADFRSGRTSEPRYFRWIPYLDASLVGDHKNIWELNRHQYLVLLAQAFRFTGRREYLATLESHLAGWLDANPFLHGINWCSALEVAFRSLSWIWILHLAGADLPAPLSARLAESLYQHGWYLRCNLSYYFSPNTHLLGEAVALHAIAAAFPAWSHSNEWRRTGARVARAQLDTQVEDDGSHFEQSSYYHVYALDFFLFHYLIAGDPPPPKLKSMADYLHALLGPARAIPLIGDDDGGRLFHPYGPGPEFGRATLATCALLFNEPWPFDSADVHPQAAWWMGASTLGRQSAGSPPVTRMFRNSGIASFVDGDTHVIFDAGPFGRGSGGHSHADTLSIVVRRAAEELLIDAGTCTYVGDPIWRERFRGTAAHNTIRVDNKDQAQPAGPFRWTDKPSVELVAFTDRMAEAVCRASHYTHRRRIALEDGCLIVLDTVEGGSAIELFWHFGVPVAHLSESAVRAGDRAILVVSGGGLVSLSEGAENGWRSLVYGSRSPAPVLRISGGAGVYGTLLDLQGERKLSLLEDKLAAAIRAHGT